MRMSYPLERTAIGQGMLRMATSRDGSTSFEPNGTSGVDVFENLTNQDTASYFLPMLEIAYARYKDPGYAWVLSLPPTRNAPGWLGRFPWGYTALSHGEPLPEASHPAASAQRRVSWAGIRHATRG